MTITGDPNGVIESFPTPTSGSGIPEAIQISGAGVTSATSSTTNQSKATLALNGGSQVQLALTATPVDAFGNACNFPGPVLWVAYDASPASLAAADPNGVTETYPTGATFASIAVNQSGVVTAKAKGNYIIEARVIAGQVSNANGSAVIDQSGSAVGLASQDSIVYGQLALQVAA